MIHQREYKGLTIQIEGAWSEDNQSNLYRWRVVNSQRVIPLECNRAFRDFNEAYSDAAQAIDKWCSSSTQDIADSFVRSMVFPCSDQRHD